VLFAGALMAVSPDADVIAFKLGIPYEHMLGHRGFSHSLLFAVLAGALCAAISRRETRAAIFFMIAFASHGILDALTNGGLGVGFFIPFNDARYFFPFTPIEVSPISPRHFVTGRAFDVIASELLWIWIPLTIVWMISQAARTFAASRPKE
jgi:inner membrane protein